MWLGYWGGPGISILSCEVSCEIKVNFWLFDECAKNNSWEVLVKKTDSMDILGPPQYSNHIVDSNLQAMLKTTTQLFVELQWTSLKLASILKERLFSPFPKEYWPSPVRSVVTLAAIQWWPWAGPPCWSPLCSWDTGTVLAFPCYPVRSAVKSKSNADYLIYVYVKRF